MPVRGAGFQPAIWGMTGRDAGPWRGLPARDSGNDRQGCRSYGGSGSSKKQPSVGSFYNRHALQKSSFFKYTIGVLIWTILVILWGAWVRITGSGAGCGNHWPLCDGQVIPRAPEIETMIELTHRLTSGLAMAAVVVLVVWAFRLFPPGHRIRKASIWVLLFILAEALIGAGLVLFGLVGDDDSLARAWIMGFHLVNTFLLLGSLCLTALFIRGWKAPVWNRTTREPALWLGGALLGMLLLGATGAVTALGDTLFPAGAAQVGSRAPESPAVHFLIALRIYHPVLAVILGVYVLAASYRITSRADSPLVEKMGRLTVSLYLVQLGVGALNVLLMAPGWLQIVHLLMADLIWLSLICFAVFSLQTAAEAEPLPVGLTQPAESLG
jgi:heme A synthase